MATSTLPSMLLLLLLLVAANGSNAGSSFQFGRSCSIIRFNYFYNKYELSLKLIMNGAAKTRAGGSLLVSADSALASKQSGLIVRARVLNRNSARVSILCSSFGRLRNVRDEVISNPRGIASGLRFSFGDSDFSSQQSSSAAAVAALPRVGLVPARCGKGWIVLQQRVDGSLSFAQNWKTYEQGFGNIRGNYWMGLKNLHSMMLGSHYKPCRLRMEFETVSGRKVVGEMNHFFVYGRANSYRVIVTSPARGNSIRGSALKFMNRSKFSTYDRDNDRAPRHHCSRLYGYGGWWYYQCHNINPNGAYPEKHSKHDPTFATFVGKGWELIKKSKIMFKCYS